MKAYQIEYKDADGYKTTIESFNILTHLRCVFDLIAKGEVEFVVKIVND